MLFTLLYQVVTWYNRVTNLHFLIVVEIVSLVEPSVELVLVDLTTEAHRNGVFASRNGRSDVNGKDFVVAVGFVGTLEGESYGVTITINDVHSSDGDDVLMKHDLGEGLSCDL